MSGPSPFEIGRDIGNNFYNAQRRVRDENAIEGILSKALQSGDPQVFQNSIGQILSQVSPERQGMAVQYLQNTAQQIQQKQLKERQAKAAREQGINPDLSEDLQKTLFENNLLDRRAQSIMGGSQNAIPSQNPQQPQSNPNLSPAQNSIQSGLRALNDDQLIQLTGVKGYAEPAKQELKRRQEERNINQQDKNNKSKFGQDVAKEVLKRADEIAESIPQKQSALTNMIDAIANKNLGFFSWDNLAEQTGINAFRTPEGALFKTSAKEYFLGSIARAGARPNQWIEQQISDMLTKIGNSTEANLTIARALQNELDIEKERIRLTNEIATQIEDGDGNYRSLGPQVNEKLQSYAEQKQNELFNDLRAIKSIESNQPQKFKKVAEGTLISPYMIEALLKRFNYDADVALKKAQELGYDIAE